MFIAARVREKTPGMRPLAVKASDTLLRFQFLELLLRVAVARFAKTGEVPNASAAVDKLFDKLLSSSEVVERGNKELQNFLALYHTESCDAVLKNHESLLRSIYGCNSGRFDAPGGERQMSAKEFEDVLADAGAFTESFPQREAMYAFAMGMQLYPDELFDVTSSKMSFLEFLHGLGAAAYLRRENVPLAATLEPLLKRVAGSRLLTGMLRMLA